MPTNTEDLNALKISVDALRQEVSNYRADISVHVQRRFRSAVAIIAMAALLLMSVAYTGWVLNRNDANRIRETVERNCQDTNQLRAVMIAVLEDAAAREPANVSEYDLQERAAVLNAALGTLADFEC